MRAHEFRLVPFQTPMFAIEITGSVAFQSGALSVTYRIGGAVEHVKYTGAAARPARKNELWRSTCFELFAKLPDSTEYWEYNLAPNGDWNAYRFTRYRGELHPEAQIADIKIATTSSPSGLASLSVKLPLPSPLLGRKLAIGISSVIEDRDGNVHYFALRHGGTKPDFHDPFGFLIEIDPASA